MGYLQEVTSLCPRADCGRRPFVCAWSIPSLLECVALEAVCIDHQCAPPGAPPKEIVTRVSDDEPQVVVPGKVDAIFHMTVRLRRDDVDAVEARGAWLSRIVGGPTRFIRKIRPKLGSRLLDSDTVSKSSRH